VRLVSISGMVSEEWLVSYFAMQIFDERLDNIPGILLKMEAGPCTGIATKAWLVLVNELLRKRGWSLYRA
jgi:hypothetical protein